MTFWERRNPQKINSSNFMSTQVFLNLKQAHIFFSLKYLTKAGNDVLGGDFESGACEFEHI